MILIPALRPPPQVNLTEPFYFFFSIGKFSQGESEVEVQQCPLPTRPLQGNRLAGGGNNKLLYCGVQDQYYTYTMTDIKLILGDTNLPGIE